MWPPSRSRRSIIPFLSLVCAPFSETRRVSFFSVGNLLFNARSSAPSPSLRVQLVLMAMPSRPLFEGAVPSLPSVLWLCLGVLQFLPPSYEPLAFP